MKTLRLLHPLSYSMKLADRQISRPVEPISYTITLENPGMVEYPDVHLTDDLPDHLDYLPGSLTASKGQATYQNGVISWNDALAAQEQVQVAFTATIDELAPLYQSITNTAKIQGDGEIVLRNTAVQIVPYRIYNPLIIKPCPPLFSDDFSNPGSGWPVGDDGESRLEYLNSEYRILVRPTYWSAGATPGVKGVDYSVSVDLRNPNNFMGSYGIAFGIAPNWSTLYTLEIYPDGWYGIYRWDSNGLVILSEAYSPEILQGKATNQIKVDRNGTSIKAYANGQLLTSVTDGFYTGSLFIGLVAFSYNKTNVDIRFDNFTVYASSCPATYPALSTESEGMSLLGQQFPYDYSTDKHHPEHGR